MTAGEWSSPLDRQTAEYQPRCAFRATPSLPALAAMVATRRAASRLVCVGTVAGRRSSPPILAVDTLCNVQDTRLYVGYVGVKYPRGTQTYFSGSRATFAASQPPLPALQKRHPWRTSFPQGYLRGPSFRHTQPRMPVCVALSALHGVESFRYHCRGWGTLGAEH